MKKVLVIDTSILCVWLDIPDFEPAEPDEIPRRRQRHDAETE